MKVKAIRKGYFKGIIRDEGAVFEIEDDKQLGKWMEPLEGEKKPAPKAKAKKPSKEDDEASLDKII